MARILALDYGLKRTGIAVTDSLQIIATGLTTIDSKEISQYLKDYTKNEVVECIVVGYPRRMDTSDTHATKPVLELINMLKKQFPHVPIEMIDERFTSKMATQSILMSGLKKKDRQDKGLVDKVSATIILQSFLESEKVKREKRKKI